MSSNVTINNIMIDVSLGLYEQTKLQNLNKNQDVNIINDKFAMIQIPKTGSTTILHELVKTDMVQHLPFYRHEGLNIISQFIDKNIPIYCIVRNPYKQVFSYFFHKVNAKEEILDVNLSFIENFRNWVSNFDLKNEAHVNQYLHLKLDKKISNKITIFKFEDGIDTVLTYLKNEYSLNVNVNSHKNINKTKKELELVFKDYFDEITKNKIYFELKECFVHFNYPYELPE
jgi:hypothetical protein